MDVARNIARYLLKTQAVQLNPSQPFTWASGWKSPIYCDNRITLSDPEARNYIKNALSQAAKEHFTHVECIAGVATAGIPQGALVADTLELPFAYVRPKPKEHGMGKQVEGKISPKQKVLLVEDLISTGNSSLKAVEALQQHEIEIVGMLAIFTYGFDIANENFAAKGISLHTLSDYSTLLREAQDLNYISAADLEELKAWRENPAVWRSC